MSNPAVPASDWTVFITGATSGIGRAAALAFAQRGARLVLTGRSLATLAEVRAQVNVPVFEAVLDVRDRNAVERVVRELPEPFRAITHLVNNAGLALGIEPAHAASLDEWETMIDTNVKGLVYCTRAILPGMVEAKRGHILNMGSVAGTYPYPGGNVYGATKAFVEQFSLNLRADLAGTSVRVSNIEPGMVDTGFSTTRFRGDKAKADAVYANMKPLSAEDIAELMIFCADRPPHLNINRIEVMPVMQSFGAFNVSRTATT